MCVERERERESHSQEKVCEWHMKRHQLTHIHTHTHKLLHSPCQFVDVTLTPFFHSSCRYVLRYTTGRCNTHRFASTALCTRLYTSAYLRHAPITARAQMWETIDMGIESQAGIYWWFILRCPDRSNHRQKFASKYGALASVLGEFSMNQDNFESKGWISPSLFLCLCVWLLFVPFKAVQDLPKELQGLMQRIRDLDSKAEGEILD